MSRNLWIGVIILLLVGSTIVGYKACSTSQEKTVAQQTATTTPATTEVVTNEDGPWFPWKVLICFVVGIVALAISFFVRYDDTRPWQSAIPEPWSFAVFLGIPLALWLIWAISPTVYAGVANDKFFWPVVFAATLAAFLISQPNPGRAARMTSVALVLLIIPALLMGIISAFSSSKNEGAAIESSPLQAATVRPTPPVAPTPDGEIEITLRPGQPTILHVPSMHRWDMLDPVPDPNTWRMEAVRDSHGMRIQLFELVSPATEVKFKVLVSKCPDIAHCGW